MPMDSFTAATICATMEFRSTFPIIAETSTFPTASRTPLRRSSAKVALVVPLAGVGVVVGSVLAIDVGIMLRSDDGIDSRADVGIEADNEAGSDVLIEVEEA